MVRVPPDGFRAVPLVPVSAPTLLPNPAYTIPNPEIDPDPVSATPRTEVPVSVSSRPPAMVIAPENWATAFEYTSANPPPMPSPIDRFTGPVGLLIANVPPYEA